MKLLQAALCFLGAAFFAITAWYVVDVRGSKYILAFCIAVAAVLGLFGVIKLLDWVADRQVEYAMAIADIRSTTPQVRALEAVSNLTPSQQELLLSRVVNMRYLTSPNSPAVRAIVCAPSVASPDGELVPAEFAQEFIHDMSREYFPAVRRWSEGSHERRYAEALTKLLYIQGWAEEARGNAPARIIMEHGGTIEQAVERVEIGLGLKLPAVGVEL